MLLVPRGGLPRRGGGHPRGGGRPPPRASFEGGGPARGRQLAEVVGSPAAAVVVGSPAAAAARVGSPAAAGGGGELRVAPLDLGLLEHGGLDMLTLVRLMDFV